MFIDELRMRPKPGVAFTLDTHQTAKAGIFLFQQGMNFRRIGVSPAIHYFLYSNKNYA